MFPIFRSVTLFLTFLLALAVFYLLFSFQCTVGFPFSVPPFILSVLHSCASAQKTPDNSFLRGSPLRGPHKSPLLWGRVRARPFLLRRFLSSPQFLPRPLPAAPEFSNGCALPLFRRRYLLDFFFFRSLRDLWWAQEDSNLSLPCRLMRFSSSLVHALSETFGGLKRTRTSDLTLIRRAL